MIIDMTGDVKRMINKTLFLFLSMVLSSMPTIGMTLGNISIIDKLGNKSVFFEKSIRILGFSSRNIQVFSNVKDSCLARFELSSLQKIVFSPFDTGLISNEEKNLYTWKKHNIQYILYVSNKTTSIKLAIYSLNGQKLFEQQLSVEVGYNTFELSLDKYTPGAYICRIEISSQEHLQVKFIK